MKIKRSTLFGATMLNATTNGGGLLKQQREQSLAVNQRQSPATDRYQAPVN